MPTAPAPRRRPTVITGHVNQTKLIEIVAADSNLPVDQVRETVRATFDVIARANAGGYSVTITNFGAWVARRARNRRFRNPQNGEAVNVAARWETRFRVSPRLREVVRNHKPAAASLRKAPQGGLKERP